MKEQIVVAIPCYNEEVTIAKVVGDFKRVLPQAEIYVFNNNSKDKSATLAAQAGAHVVTVRKQGKGYVMQAIFEHISCDVLIVVDGDDTYFAEEAPMLIKPVVHDNVDMVVGDRLKKANKESLVYLHQIGNRLIVDTINWVFKTKFEDILSGYRIFSRRFIESVPLITPGFETETELTLQALEAGMEVIEVPISYRSRPSDSKSKLHPFKDGLRIMLTAAMLLRDHYPLRLYGAISIFCFSIAIYAAIVRFLFPASLGMSVTFLAGLILLFMPIGVISLGIGLTLSAVNTRLKEMKQLMKRTR